MEVAALLKGDAAEALQRAVGLFADGEEDAWSVLEAEHPGDATDVLKAYARVAKQASRDLIDASQAPATNESIVDEDESLAKQSDGDVAKRCREAASEIVGETDRQKATLQKWHGDLQCVAKHDDDDEPPMRLGGDRAHALGRHQGPRRSDPRRCSGCVWKSTSVRAIILVSGTLRRGTGNATPSSRRRADWRTTRRFRRSKFYFPG